MGKSSKDKRDAYYRLAKEQNWRARSAFKLIQIDEIFDLFSHSEPEAVTRVVDLCAAPGSWSQVLSRVLIRGESFGRRTWEERRKREQNAIARQLGDSDNQTTGNGLDAEPEEDKRLKPRENVKIVAIDLQPMTPLEGIVTLEADITHPSTVPLLLNSLDLPVKPDSASPSAECRSVDLVLSDGAPDVTGLHDLDIYIQSQLLYAALNLAIRILRQGGKFVAKIFRGRDVDLLYAQLKTVFEQVSVAKPRSSRASSLEAFVVCEGFMPPVDANLTFPLTSAATMATTTLDAEVDMDADAQNRWIPPFIACGDLSSWDSDANYALPPNHVSLDPVQPPTAPPYKKALEQRRVEGGALGKTKKGQVIPS